ncbi:MAG: ParB/RepB/Spo0J family partition protein [Bacillota bacterium]
MSVKQRGLGKGLQALIGSNEALAEEQNPGDPGVTRIDILRIDPNPLQARKQFDKEALEQLAQSIALHGVIQPLIVSRQEGRFRLVAGERRWRAARMAGLECVPAVITELKDREQVEVSLIENLQREDLNPLEEAAGMKYLMDEYALTQEQTAERLGKSRSAVANTLRLLTLPAAVQDLVWSGALSAGHARALAGITDASLQEKMAHEAVEKGLSVREMEALRSEKQPIKSKKEKTHSLAPELYELQERMQEAVGTRVRIAGTPRRGRITIEYYNREDIERICAFLQGEG